MPWVPRAGRNLVLIAISVLFYAWVKPQVVFLLFFSALLDCWIGGLVAGRS